MATTFGGLRIDPQVRVLDQGGSPIAGLSACGEIVGGFHGTSFMTGAGLGQAATFGRAAARHIAARAGAS